MSGPPPKPKGLRQRRNKAKTAATLKEKKSKSTIPDLPIRPCMKCLKALVDMEAKDSPKRKGAKKKQKRLPPCQACNNTTQMLWHPETAQWWRLYWEGTLSQELHGADIAVVNIVAKKMDVVNWQNANPNNNDMKELRLWLKEIGHTPMARRSLQWEKPSEPEEVQTAEEAEDEEDGEDFRNLLRFEPKVETK